MYNQPIDHPLLHKIVDIDWRDKELGAEYRPENLNTWPYLTVLKVSKNTDGKLCVHLSENGIPILAHRIVNVFLEKGQYVEVEGVIYLIRSIGKVIESNIKFIKYTQKATVAFHHGRDIRHKVVDIEFLKMAKLVQPPDDPLLKAYHSDQPIWHKQV